jgi:hypothetical protein
MGVVDGLREYAKRFLISRRQAYRTTFPPTSLDARIVLEDLERFCRAHHSTGHANAQMSARLDGRREVWLRIQSHLKLTDDQLWALHSQKTLPKE